MKKVLPNSQKSFILHLLINQKWINERDTVINGYRDIISRLERINGISLKERMVRFKNKYGRSCEYKEHSIAPGYMKLAKSEFIKMVGKK